MNQPFMKLWVGDFVGDTMHLTRAEVGQYVLLLMAMWKNGGTLPGDPKLLARIARGAISDAVMAFFESDDEGIYQKRLRAELEDAQKKSIAASQSAKTRWANKPLKNKKPAHANGHAKAMLSESESDNKINTPLPPKGGGMGEIRKAFENYNKAATQLGLPLAAKLTPERERKLRARLKEHGLSGWNDALQALCEQPFCLGEGGQGWRADLDFLLQPKSLNRVRERAYARSENGI